MITSNKTEHGLFKCSKFGSLINFQCQYALYQSLNRHWSVFFCIRVHFTFILQEEKRARGVAGVGDYSRETIILNIFVQGVRFFEEGN